VLCTSFIEACFPCAVIFSHGKTCDMIRTAHLGRQIVFTESVGNQLVEIGLTILYH
jgi:hypothetical protein